ncbi:hypothetical protein ILUMI_13358 [Ignelater luminosus]|uniref:DUF5641 domain-containing protein n=1 Tax=Ignelater luminosus TaxID=2038154 RepID=A0A8K0G5W7_IGNLU|nr:hypothetical protein ILUMI_13358 [Ignelater luminosus]
MKTEYTAFMSEYESVGHITEVPCELKSEMPIYYMPHHSVQKPDSKTTKTRVVFDASCKSSTSLSLNDVLMIGPTIQDDLVLILLRFRKLDVVLIGDLASQILVDASQRDLQRIVWRESPEKQIKHYQLNTVMYGMASSSFLATRCLYQIALENAKQFPIECQDLINLKNNICKLLQNYGFKLRKLQSNNDSERLTDLMSSHDLQYTITESASIKTLGVCWIPSTDQFEYNAHHMHASVTCELDSQELLEARMSTALTTSVGIFTFNNIMNRCSKLTTLIRSVAYCLRFIKQMKALLKIRVQDFKKIIENYTTSDDSTETNYLTINEVEAAEIALLKIAQIQVFPNETKPRGWPLHHNADLDMGAIVLLKEDNIPPMQWRLGRITAVHPGKDSVVRVVSVRTKTGVTKRALSKVCLLPLEEVQINLANVLPGLLEDIPIQVIGLGGLRHWLSYSSDKSSPSFYLWEQLKTMVYKTRSKRCCLTKKNSKWLRID